MKIKQSLNIFLIFTLSPLVLSFQKFQEGCSPKAYSPLDIDLEKYKGRWYEIFVTENALKTFQKNCQCTYAEYQIIEPNQEISVNNECWKSDTHERNGIEGHATVKGPGTLNVQFFWWQVWKQPYQIIYKEGDYDFVVVISCSPYRKTPIFKEHATDYIWILSRNPIITEEQKLRAFEFLDKHHFSSSSLIQTVQNGSNCEKFHKINN